MVIGVVASNTEIRENDPCKFCEKFKNQICIFQRNNANNAISWD